MNVFNVDYKNKEAVIAVARDLVNRFGRRQVVVKYPNRDNYNITMMQEKAIMEGADIVWDSADCS